MPPTSALTFRDLVLEVSRYLGTASYGENGDGPVDIPTDAHDLTEAKRHVNNGIRKFIFDAPPAGWRWMRPTMQFELPDHESLPVNDNGVIEANYELPANFHGMYTGAPTLMAGTNQGIRLEWTAEATIRRLRENQTANVGNPRFLAIRPKQDSRRWELMVWPAPHQDVTIEFPYEVHFDSLIADDDVPPSPMPFDEAIKSVCLAVAERDGLDDRGRYWDEYHRERGILSTAYDLDNRTGPRRLGYFGNPERPQRRFGDIREFQQRLPVIFND